MGLLALFVAVLVAYVERTALAHFLPFILRDGVLTEQEAGYVLAAFGVGYVIGLPFSGRLISLLGHKNTLRLIAMGWIVSTVLFSRSETSTQMAVARLLLGIFEAPVFPLFVSWIAMRYSPEARTFRISLVEASSYFGMAVAGPIAVLLAREVGWRDGYLLTALLGLLPLTASLLLHENGSGLFLDVEKKGNSVPRSIIPRLLAIAFGFCLYNYCKSYYSTWQPSILVRQYGLTSESAAYVAFLQSISAPLVSGLLAYIAGKLLARQYSLKLSKLPLLGLGFFVSSGVFLLPLIPVHIEILSVVFFVALISTSSLIWSSIPDSADPQQVARVSGWVNAFANIGTVVSPMVIGSLVSFHLGAVFFSISFSSFCAFLLFWMVYRRR